MKVICLDLEGVLLPEFWVETAKATGIEELKRTTRDEPDYNVLMRYRLDVLRRYDLSIHRIYDVIRDLEPLPGAVEFTQWAVSQSRVIILSDTFEQFARPLMARLGHPTLFCHTLKITEDGFIEDYVLRQQDQKRKAVLALQGLNFEVIAAGDSYNDLTMLQTAEHGILFRPPESLKAEQPQFPVALDHGELQAMMAERL